MSRFTLAPDYYTNASTSDDPIITGGMKVRKLDIYYIDINTNYRVNQKGLIIYDEDVVKNQIANILATPIGSDAFEPTYGSNLPYRIQDPITDTTSFLIYNDTIAAISKWLGDRITVMTSQSYVRPLNGEIDSEGYEIRLIYYMNKTRAIAEFSSFLLR